MSGLMPTEQLKHNKDKKKINEIPKNKTGKASQLNGVRWVNNTVVFLEK